MLTMCYKEQESVAKNLQNGDLEVRVYIHGKSFITGGSLSQKFLFDIECFLFTMRL